MKIPAEERQRYRDSFREMPLPKKLEHIWQYYKVTILLTVVTAAILLSAGYRWMTRKEPVLYLACLNVSLGTQVQDQLTQDFLTEQNLDPSRKEIQLYKNLYVSDTPAAADHEYAYTSRMKLLATINARQLDLVLMNQEAYDLCSANGYLLELSDWAAVEHLAANQVVTEKAQTQYSEAAPPEVLAATTSYNAVPLNQFPGFQKAGFSGEVYLGIIANSPRLEQCRQYVQYLTSHFG